MTEAQLKAALTEKAMNFRNQCSLAIHQIESSDWSKAVSHERLALTKQNKSDKEEYMGHELPDPRVALPKYFDDEEVKVSVHGGHCRCMELIRNFWDHIA